MQSKQSKFGSVTFFLIKLASFLAGAFFLIKNREKIISHIKRQNFVIAAIYGTLLSLIAVIYRLVMALNWIIQQAGVSH